MDVSVIIVNYNTGDLVTACIDSVLKQRDIEFEIIVVENASQDNSMDLLRHYQNHITLIANEKNIGFGAANNQAFTESQGQYIFLLNPDAQLDSDLALRGLVDYLEQHPKYGLIGTKILNADGTPGPYFIPKHYPGEQHIKQKLPDLPGDIAYLICASCMIPRNLYAEIDGFDPDYFVYGEDTDICLRIRERGYAIGYLEDISVRHIGNASEVNAHQYDRVCRRQRSLHTFYRKHYALADVKYLLQKACNKSRFRLLSLRLMMLLNKQTKVQAKYHRYRAIYDTSREELTRLD